MIVEPTLSPLNQEVPPQAEGTIRGLAVRDHNLLEGPVQTDPAVPAAVKADKENDKNAMAHKPYKCSKKMGIKLTILAMNPVSQILPGSYIGHVLNNLKTLPKDGGPSSNSSNSSPSNDDSSDAEPSDNSDSSDESSPSMSSMTSCK
ncbi:hypothetical protein QCA50_018401 [Cerrena zonata]|uniref:Uncharacterized protein n=1 Tax=Cerrena zonata TaxID=2478898 RepID=A0AAW0FHV1_9APHY